jgi:hypothetical protein
LRDRLDVPARSGPDETGPDEIRAVNSLKVVDKGGRMIGAPGVVDRAGQPYAAITAVVTMDTIGQVLPGLRPEVRTWLDKAGVPIAGDPFFKYNVIDMARQLEVEVGFPVARPLTGDDRVLAGVLPAAVMRR